MDLAERINLRKKIILLVMYLLMVLAIISGGILAYWTGTIANPNNESRDYAVTIGEGKIIPTKLEAIATVPNKKLVPKDNILFSIGKGQTNTDVLTITYNVKWIDESGTVKPSDNIKGKIKVGALSFLKSLKPGAPMEDYGQYISAKAVLDNPDIILNDPNGTDVKVEVRMTDSKTIDYEYIINALGKTTVYFSLEPSEFITKI